MFCATPAVPTQTFSGCESIQFWTEKSFCFSTRRLRFVACWFSFTLGWNDRVKIKLRNDAFLKFLFKIRLKRETNLMQTCSASQHQVIMPSWLPKVPSWLRKNALCLSQSAFSNFALHVINNVNVSWAVVRPLPAWTRYISYIYLPTWIKRVPQIYLVLQTLHLRRTIRPI